MDNFIRQIDMKKISSSRVDVEEFIELFNKKEAILLDVRFPFEKDVWKVGFSLDIPLNELPDRIDELPKEKIIICACPETYRSNIATNYLQFKGYNAKILTCGLLKLMERLKGGKAKDLQIS